MIMKLFKLRYESTSSLI